MRIATLSFAACLLALPACTDAPPPSADRAALVAVEVADEQIQPSCIPNADSDGDHDDGESCEGVAGDNFCDAAMSPSPSLYCVVCTQHGTGCHPYPPDAP